MKSNKCSIFNKPPIYWDVDDVVLDSAKAAIKIINEDYNIPEGLPEKEFSDLKDWYMRSINRHVTSEFVEHIWETDRFWNYNRFRPEFLDMCEKGLTKKYTNYFITQGTYDNLYRKEQFLKNHLGKYWNKFEFIGLSFDHPKYEIDMSNGIQIDDNINHLLDTNAHCKLLLTNNICTDYNDRERFNDYDIDDIYSVRDLNDVSDILKFNVKNPL